MNTNNTAVLFLQISFDDNFPYTRYNKMAECAIKSFKKFHPDIDIYYITNENISEYAEKWDVDIYEHYGITKFSFAYNMMKKLNLKKVISLGVDTIICSRLDEFLDDDTDILCTLNYPCVEETEYWKTPILKFTDEYGNTFTDVGNINADVVCFNNVDALKKVLDLSIQHYTHFGEQGALNEMAWVDKSYNVKIIDFPYQTSKVVYNARAKGVFGTNMCNKNTPQYKFKVVDNKLYTYDGKQIKVWHYVEGWSGRPESEFLKVINSFIFDLFNDDTKKFFKEQCDCGDFFEKEYDFNG